MNLLITLNSLFKFSEYENKLKHQFHGLKFVESCEQNFCLTNQTFLGYEIYDIKHTKLGQTFESHSHKFQTSVVGSGYITLNLTIWQYRIKIQSIRTLCDSNTTFFNNSGDLKIYNKVYCRFQSTVKIDPIMMYFRKSFEAIILQKIISQQNESWANLK
ncbi:hypothetical protein SS50377_27642 [Spironucleus salmonicida]|uniref:Uncharacterized protein n=1 Tax=Spironucleus salmonicida TaxID=348837 RepID=V6LPN4_9EUKA|nr:hypothetical protein SS50377_27642 [Spironucleus salmonicida]|eukprot:EST46580.1 Hypothetical protein SS50377_13384 [Spironucleus salmonicida]